MRETIARLVGSENVRGDALIEEYRRNVSGLQRAIPLVVTPASAAQVTSLVQLANEKALKLYPISSGRNWGLGSRLPVVDDCIILDLQKMNRIVELNERHGYVVIEPGVTQIQLYEYLQAQRSNHIFNVIGSGKDTSLIGNAMDRGIGYFSPRCENLSSLEVVLGNGETLRTGFSHFAHSQVSALYRHGIGPSLDGLFFQSNFGIVTKASLDLISNEDEHAAILIALREDANLAAYIDALAALRRRGILQTAFHIANRERTRISVTPLLYRSYLRQGLPAPQALQKAEETFAREFRHNWATMGGLLGTKEQIRYSYRATRSLLKNLADVRLITDRRIAWAERILNVLSPFAAFRRKRLVLAALETVYGYCKGMPSDSALDSVTWAVDKTLLESGNPDRSDAGLLYALPLLPFDGHSLLECLKIVDEICGRHAFTPYMTFNMINDKCLESVINIAYLRNDPAGNARAHQCIESLNRAFLAGGLTPYRMGIYGMQDLFDPADRYWRIVRDLKQVFDPNHVIAPRRYNLV